ncbi:MAG: PD-(D/E)XK nuclease family protein [Puniceicoccales bacterium]|nr:PD-(D/E)XK nuclease family protein [Puniceicoccales bacterium]
MNTNTPRFYTSLCSEVGDVCDFIGSNPGKRVCLLCGDCSSNFYSAITSELDYRGIKYDDFVGHRKFACVAYLEVFRHWTSWQVSRDIFAFIKFYQDLVAQEICRFDEFNAINKKINSLLYRYLIPNCDVFFRALEGEKFLQNFLGKYDLKKERVPIARFLFSLKIALGEFLSEDLLGELDAEFSPYDQTSYENFAVLAKVAEAVFKSYEPCKNREQISNVAIASSPMAARDEYDLCVCSFTDRQNFDRFAEYILVKKKCIITCVAKSYNEVPDFLKQISFTSIGKILNADDFQNYLIKRSHIGPYQGADASIFQTKTAHDSRNNAREKFDEYSYMIDLESMHGIACKTVEFLLKNPANAFYDYVLKLESVHFWLDVGANKKIFLGSLVHELLNVGEYCCATPTLEQFCLLIDGKWEVLWKEMAAAYSAAGADVSYFVLEIFHLAKYMAYKFAAKIIFLGYKFMATEVNVPCCSISGEIKLTGRIDCILSNENFALNPSAAINIFDFKTSKYNVLNSAKISSQLAEYTGVQLYMYGLAYKSAGFNDVGVQVLQCDCEDVLPVNMNVFLNEGGQIFAELSRMFQSGILGEKPVKFTSNLANLPLATAMPPNNVVERKLKIT